MKHYILVCAYLNCYKCCEFITRLLVLEVMRLILASLYEIIKLSIETVGGIGLCLFHFHYYVRNPYKLMV